MLIISLRWRYRLTVCTPIFSEESLERERGIFLLHFDNVGPVIDYQKK
jgi:hypothetical protein